VGNPFLASDFLFQIINTANSFYQKTGGIFNPYIGQTICELGYDKSFEMIQTKRNGLYNPNQIATEYSVEINSRMKSITLANGIAVDLGGIAKGWAAQQISELLRGNGITSGAIDAGGDLVLWGNRKEEWEVEIADPIDPNQNVFRFNIGSDAGIATSSAMKRRWQNAEGESIHHIIDPRTLKSGDSDLIQVTVLAPDLTTAEVFAKCLLILGEDKGKLWLAERAPQLAYLGVKSDFSLVMGGKLEKYCMEGVGTT
jgi:thiamine biosynthesis lipoprotein